MCVFVFFVTCFFFNVRLVTYNSTNLQLFFFYFPGDKVMPEKSLGPRFCFVLFFFFLFLSLSQRLRKRSLPSSYTLLITKSLFFWKPIGCIVYCVFLLFLFFFQQHRKGNNRDWSRNGVGPGKNKWKRN